MCPSLGFNNIKGETSGAKHIVVALDGSLDNSRHQIADFTGLCVVVRAVYWGGVAAPSQPKHTYIAVFIANNMLVSLIHNSTHERSETPNWKIVFKTLMHADRPVPQKEETERRQTLSPVMDVQQLILCRLVLAAPQFILQSHTTI